MSAAAVMTADRKVEALADLRLLPHERWFASAALRRQQTHRTATILRIEHNYGPVGTALMPAALADNFLGAALAVVGIVFLVISGVRGTLLAVAYGWLCAGWLVLIVGMVRAVQGILAGRKFRHGRPFIKRGP